jgi:hypothetical protein
VVLEKEHFRPQQIQGVKREDHTQQSQQPWTNRTGARTKDWHSHHWNTAKDAMCIKSHNRI